MMRHRSGAAAAPQQATDEGGASSSSDEDVFSALSTKKKRKKTTTAPPAAATNRTSMSPPRHDEKDGNKKKEESSRSMNEKPSAGSTAGASSLPPAAAASGAAVLSNTSSTKRHHGAAADSTRAAKMDALLLELEAEKERVAHRPDARRAGGRTEQQHSRNRGSHVDEGDELITTNIFVGNLAPSITEEQMTDLFRQFGDLYSVKIMWPRTMEERLRDRNTGFVCFMHRNDAEDAMVACSEADPFNVGRRLMMRWGKNVKKSAGGVPLVKKGTGGIAEHVVVAPSSSRQKQKSDLENHRAAAALEASLTDVDERSSIRVVPPPDKRRAHFISTVASYVAKDGQQFERMLIQRELQNPAFGFLTIASNAFNDEQKQEHIFYRWRVYSFCQGDGFHTWRVEPFTMFAQHGCTWIPPPIDVEAARREEEEAARKQQDIEQQKQQRRFLNSKRGFMTGRQLEQARRRGGGGPDEGAKLTPEELRDFDRLFREELCASRESICQAMAFCFEKSSAAKHISDLLRGLLLDIPRGTSADTMIARLFLISDVLFNSQQPGIRNAFLYRGAVESMSPDAFKNLGAFSRENFRFTGRKRLASAVTAVLAAWANWGVYDPVFLDELQAHFEGKEIAPRKTEEKHSEDEDETKAQDAGKADSAREDSGEEAAVSDKPRGDWTAVSVDAQKEATDGETVGASTSDEVIQDGLDGSPIVDQELQPSAKSEGYRGDREAGEPLDGENPDGEPLDEIVDGEPLDEEDPDGEALSEEDTDGEALSDADTADGEPLESLP